jgi:hypothetical protein
METYLIKAVLREANRPLRVELYYVTVEKGADPLVALEAMDFTPDLVSPFIIHTLPEDEAIGFGFKEGEIRNVIDA